MTTMNPVSKSPEPNRAAKAAKQVKKFFVWMIVFILVCTAGTVAFLMYASYGDGYRVGTILKLARKGVIFKTWEGELSQGFLESAPDVSAGVGTRIWYFTVDRGDDEVIRQLDHAIEQNKKVKLYYEERYTILPWVGDTRQVVYKVEEIE